MRPIDKKWEPKELDTAPKTYPTEYASRRAYWKELKGEWEDSHVRVTDKGKKALDTQVDGKHYKDFKIQPIEYIEVNKLDYLQGNVVKYVTRHKLKNGVQDINKAIHYLELIKEMQYNDSFTK